MLSNPLFSTQAEIENLRQQIVKMQGAAKPLARTA
jgi:hypothetical protein